MARMKPNRDLFDLLTLWTKKKEVGGGGRSQSVPQLVSRMCRELTSLKFCSLKTTLNIYCHAPNMVDNARLYGANSYGLGLYKYCTFYCLVDVQIFHVDVFRLQKKRERPHRSYIVTSQGLVLFILFLAKKKV